MSFYIKVHLIGDEETTIIAKFKGNFSHHRHDEFDPYETYVKAKDVITGTPLILDCTYGKFKDEIEMYGISRLNRIGAKEIEIEKETKILDKKDVLEILKGMTEEDIKNYTKAIQKAKEEHNAWRKEYLNEYFSFYPEVIKERLDYIKQKSRVKRIQKR